MQIPAGRLLAAAWAIFVLRGAFYSILLPPWEGFDEWAHFAYIQHLAETGTAPGRADPIPATLCGALRRSPLARYASAGLPGALSYLDYWTHPQSEPHRSVCPAPTLRQYEAQQPPLYYLLLTPVYRLFQQQPIATRLLAIRLVSILLASTCLLSLHAIATRLHLDPPFAGLALCAVAAAPGLFIDIARTGNESLAIALVSALLLASLQCIRHPSHASNWVAFGLLAAAALLTKAYALAFLPVLLLITARVPRGNRANVLFAALPIIGVAAFWYPAVWRDTRTLSGEQFDMALAQLSLPQRAAAVVHINWLKVLDIAAFTHIWTGGWSFLVARAWMYRAIELFAVAATAGLLRAAARRSRRACVLLAFLLPMAAVLAYHALAAYAATGNSTAIGWYFYAVIVAESVGAALGFHALCGPRIGAFWMAALVTALSALDLYTVHILLMPHYTGIPGGEILHAGRTVVLSDTSRSMLREILRRLAAPWILPASAIAGIWAVGVLSTIALPALAAATLGARRLPGRRSPQARVRPQTTLGRNGPGA